MFSFVMIKLSFHFIHTCTIALIIVVWYCIMMIFDMFHSITSTIELNIAAISRAFNLWLIVLHALMSLQFLQWVKSFLTETFKTFLAKITLMFVCRGVVWFFIFFSWHFLSLIYELNYLHRMVHSWVTNWDCNHIRP